MMEPVKNAKIKILSKELGCIDPRTRRFTTQFVHEGDEGVVLDKLPLMEGEQWWLLLVNDGFVPAHPSTFEVTGWPKENE